MQRKQLRINLRFSLQRKLKSVAGREFKALTRQKGCISHLGSLAFQLNLC
ncbi:hypothetical protein HMPREF1872_01079 [Amygdalobacter nucleatus]|uniref:Uncharacterized protein n=1 Tax=Amygdalobacter nucleatus TaxID=3029274 RepID=A0A133Y9N6_9FIRM|nr:hypothetical protein HMPREF1872_01079 [Amygdalobacter nucleatus]